MYFFFIAESDSDIDSQYGEHYCKICGMSFHRYDLMKRHLKTHSAKKENFKEELIEHNCNDCGENFAEALDLLAHAEVHARVNNIKYKHNLFLPKLFNNVEFFFFIDVCFVVNHLKKKKVLNFI